MITLLKKYWLTILYVLIVLILCFMNPAAFPASPVKNFDKLVHVLMFLGLSGVVFFDNTNYLRSPISKMRIFLSSLLFPIALGGLIEIMQADLTKTRTGDWYDFFSDQIGAFIGYVIALLINNYFLLREKI